MSAAHPALLNPRVDVADASVAHWLRQATVRLRREVAWCWANRTGEIVHAGLPPLVDAAAANLDLTRYDADKRRFFESDVTARYLTEQLRVAEPASTVHPARGGWDWLVRELELTPAAQFVLALGLAARLDSALGAVCSACLNDSSRPYPTLALAQRLWEEPGDIMRVADPAHPLYRHGVLAWPGDAAAGFEWHHPLEVHAWVAQTLLDPTSELPSGLELADGASPLTAEQRIVQQRLAAAPPTALQLVPLLGSRDADYAGVADALARGLRQRLVVMPASFAPERQALLALAATAWLRGIDVLVPEGWAARLEHKPDWFAPLLAVPVRCYVPITEPAASQALPHFALAPLCTLPALTFEERRQLFAAGLGDDTGALSDPIAECARRFRFERRAIERVVRGLPHASACSGDELLAACRVEALSEFGHLAQPVASRFTLADLVLPPAQTQQIDEIRQAMQSLTTVHHRWGTARAWNEGGLAVCFGGPPGSGKTMAAEALAQALQLPMYRIDLSQVVNKYVGETSKNLKRIFDAAEIADCILFFDEADALFGKRTDVKDAHDRFANIEISYLLERMERFKGLAILATNRKKDLDEAFMRRLRAVVEFPLPGLAERERIWRAVFPPGVDTSAVDFPYLSRQFPLSGGHIRSIAFNACLLSAKDAAKPAVSMATVLVALKRELDKLNRAAGDEMFGVYAPMLRGRVA
jgi:hypothetical protein